MKWLLGSHPLRVSKGGLFYFAVSFATGLRRNRVGSGSLFRSSSVTNGDKNSISFHFFVFPSVIPSPFFSLSFFFFFLRLSAFQSIFPSIFLIYFSRSSFLSSYSCVSLSLALSSSLLHHCTAKSLLPLSVCLPPFVPPFPFLSHSLSALWVLGPMKMLLLLLYTHCRCAVRHQLFPAWCGFLTPNTAFLRSPVNAWTSAAFLLLRSFSHVAAKSRLPLVCLMSCH